MTNITKGIQVIGRGGDREIVEIEYFHGLDVKQLDGIPNFAQNLTETQAVWPQDNGRCVKYNVARAHCKPNLPDEMRLVVTYDQEQNPEIVEIFGDNGEVHDHLWGTTSIVLKQGIERGRYEWQGNDGQELTGEWVAFDLEAGCARPSYTYRGSKREGAFRAMILSLDDHRCVLTDETTEQALDAAHLIPAANGQNDLPCNGITLRTDLHRLFDADLFTFQTNGQVVKIAPGLSPYYRCLLRDLHLPAATLNRVGGTLRLPPFQDR